MSYFSITDFIKSGRKSLENKNYWSALSVALALPSMCSRIMFFDDEYKSTNSKHTNGYWHLDKNNNRYWHDEKCYVDFCKEVMRVNQCYPDKGQPDGWLCNVLGPNFPNLLYQLRCDIIHAGTANIYDDDKGIYLMFGETATSTICTKYRTIDISSLCNTIFDHTSTWCLNYGAENFKYTYVFDMDNSRDDRLLYQRLCDDDRADYLKQQFEEEQKQNRKDQNK